MYYSPEYECFNNLQHLLRSEGVFNIFCTGTVACSSSPRLYLPDEELLHALNVFPRGSIGCHFVHDSGIRRVIRNDTDPFTEYCTVVSCYANMYSFCLIIYLLIIPSNFDMGFQPRKGSL